MDGTILLIDYSEYEREKIKIIFENIGEYEFIEVGNLKQLYSLIGNLNSLSLIIMDIAFPSEKEGFEILTFLRKSPKTAAVPVIITTKSDNADLRRSALKFNVSDFVLKPYQTKRLENSIRIVMKIDQNFRYIVSSANVITMSIEDYITKEFKIASRADQSLSIILITPINLNKESEQQKSLDPNFKQKMYTNAVERVKISSRSTDTVILNENKDILLILPFTNSAGAERVLEKVKENVGAGLKDLNIKYNDYFYAVHVTFPNDGKNFQALMEKAIKKVEDKIMLEKITSIGASALENARNTYKRFNM